MPGSKTQSRKSFGQRCPVASALDVVGDRWTLLIMRELLGGPARFRDLLEGLPGIAKNLLTNRLRQLEADGVIRRIGAQALYALTEQGEAIRPIIESLGFWGMKVQRVAPVEHERSVRAIAMALQAILSRRRDAMPLDRQVIELEVNEEVLEMALGENPTATVRPATGAQARLRTSSKALSRYLNGKSLGEKDFVFVDGHKGARKALLRALGAGS
jgi:DNA-binding HxlR family transcriptional regulator